MPVKACLTRVLVDEFDFSGVSNSAIVEMTTNVIEYSVFQNCSVLKLPDTITMMMQHAGYFTTADPGTLEAEMEDRLGIEDPVWVAMLFGTAYNTPIAYLMNMSFNQQLRIAAQTKGLVSVDGSWHTANGVNLRGYQIYRGTPTTTGAQTAQDMEAAGTSGKAFLFVSGITGTATDATVELQGYTDASFTVPVDLGTFTFSDVGVQELTLGSTVHQYLRANVTDMGGADDFSIVCIVCSNGVTY